MSLHTNCWFHRQMSMLDTCDIKALFSNFYTAYTNKLDQYVTLHLGNKCERNNDKPLCKKNVPMPIILPFPHF